MPSRTGNPGGGFVTKPKAAPAGTTTTGNYGEDYYYVVEMTPTEDAFQDTQSGPRMAPVLDDVIVLYAPWATARVITEAEVAND